jgi:hypothetical protein
MKKFVLPVLITGFIFISLTLSAQKEKYYSESGGEFIFSFADVEKNGLSVTTPMRFSMFLHLGQNYHWNLNEYAGLFTGYGLRNIGYITKEDNLKMKRRTYSIGIPLAVKFGAMDKNFFLYGGTSFELFFHYKQKQFIDGEKSKFSEWFSPRTERFAQSFFAGMQFPGGLNLKFKYYPGEFLNRDFRGVDFTQEVDYSIYNRSNLFYVALSFNFRPDKIMENIAPKSHETRYASWFK